MNCGLGFTMPIFTFPLGIDCKIIKNATNTNKHEVFFWVYNVNNKRKAFPVEARNINLQRVDGLIEVAACEIDVVDEDKSVSRFQSSVSVSNSPFQQPAHNHRCPLILLFLKFTLLFICTETQNNLNNMLDKLTT